MLRSLFFIFCLLVTGLGFYSCSPPPENDGLSTQQKTPGRFDGIQTIISGNITVRQGNSFAVRLRGDKKLLAAIVVDTVDNVLEIKYKDGVHLRGFFQPVEVAVTMPEVHQLSILGSGNIFLKDTFRQQQNLQLNVSGSGSFDIEYLSLSPVNGSVEVRINGSGACKIKGGTGAVANVFLNGSGSVNMADFKLSKGKVKILGSGNVKINASKYLNAAILGSGNIYYVGDPKIDKEVSGSGSVFQL